MAVDEPPPPDAEPPPPDADAPAGPSRAARARAQAEALRRQADTKVKQLEAQRPANRWIDAAFSTLERDVSSGGGVLAAALAFRIFIFLVPFVFVIVTAFPTAADAANTDPADLADRFGMAGLTASAISSAADLSFWNRIGLLAAGLFALLLASRSLVWVLRITHGLAWHARVPKLEKPLRAATVLIGAIFGLVIFGALTARLQDRIGVIGLIPMLFAGAAVAAIWTFVQYHLPRQDVPWKRLVPGAVVVGLGVEGLQLLTVLWFTRYIESKSETYGAIGAALAILLWAYFLGRIIVSGAMLNAALWEQDRRAAAPAPPRHSSPSPHPEHRSPEPPEGSGEPTWLPPGTPTWQSGTGRPATRPGPGEG